MPNQRVPFHAAEPERAVALQEHDLALRPRQFGSQGVAGTRPQAAKRTAVQPTAWQIAVDHPAGVRPEIARIDND
ncbi:Uncharacterised protein [Mycobacterium tuberculosis]|uniref:Uncharacterized protein n=1 Tax=Mycobacterium tuberculosis TaxID=1773 RepID=A0A916L9I0_MYCTX|nr:Uncharacterised protein [Mycobacterium tuberculosis]